jgi:hypothetical protein
MRSAATFPESRGNLKHTTKADTEQARLSQTHANAQTWDEETLPKNIRAFRSFITLRDSNALRTISNCRRKSALSRDENRTERTGLKLILFTSIANPA